MFHTSDRSGILTPNLPALATLLFLVSTAVMLPVEATTVAGRTPGSFAVSQTGAATYTIPIWAPPGPHGMQPHIALTYNSQGGNGYVGVGWSLSGLSSIYRCSLTYAQDAAPAPVALVTSDGYCMDGQRLRLTSGSYGLDGSTYQTEVANFVTATAHGSQGNGPSYWTATDRNGRTYTYGAGGTVTNAQVIASGSSPSTALAWELNEVSDPSSNTMTIAYNLTTGSSPCVATANLPVGSAIPCIISWTPSSHGSSSYNYTMNFVYGANVVPPAGYVAGTPVTNPSLLGSITVNYSGSTVKKYVLSYQASSTTGRDNLTQVQECSDSAGSNCLLPTKITYQTPTVGISSTATSTSITTAKQVYSLHDFNGDGYTDLLFSNGTTWYVAFGSASGYGTPVSTGISASTTIVPGAFLGKGADGILANKGGTWYYYTWNGSAFSSVSTGLAYDSTASQYVAADVTGSGLPSLVKLWLNPLASTYDTALIVYVNLNTGGGNSVSFGAAQSTYSLTPFNLGGCAVQSANIAASSDQANTLGRLKYFDFNGDGRQDLLLTATAEAFNNGLSCTSPYTYKLSTFELISNSTSTTAAFGANTLALANSTSFNWVPLNWNSDSCTDLYFSPTNTVYISACNGSTGASFTVPQGTVIGAMDWNGDGLTDLLVDINGYIEVYPSTGDGIGNVQATNIPYYSSTTYFTFDANGDGMDDLGHVTPTGTVSYYPHSNAGQPPDLATSFTDGYGNSASPTYVSLVQNNYTNLSDATYPYQNYVGPLYVVNEAVFSDPSTNSGTYNQKFSYTGAWTNLQGRGLQAFDLISVLDSRNSLYEYKYFSRAFPSTGMLLNDTISGGFGFYPSQTSNSVTVMNLLTGTHNQSYFPYYSGVTTTVHELNGPENGDLITTTTTNYTYDNYGNATSIAKTVTDNDPGSPYNGQIWSQTTTNTPVVNPPLSCTGLFTETQVAYSDGIPADAVTRTKTFTPDTTNCRYTQIVTEPNSSQFKVTENIGYDNFGNVNSDSVTGVGMGTASPATRTTTITWTSTGVTTGQFPMTVVDPTGATTGTTTFTYNLSYGLKSGVTDPNNIPTSWQYTDGFGRVTRETRPDTTYTTVSYGNCATDGLGCVVGSNGTVVSYGVYSSGGTLINSGTTGLDQVDRPVVQLSGLLGGSVSRTDTRYDSLGNVSLSSFPCFYGGTFTTACTYWTTNSYDVLNRLVESQRPINASSGGTLCAPPANPPAQPASGCQETVYAYAGRTTTVTDALANSTSTITDVNGWIRRTTDAYGYYVTSAYDAAGSKTSVTDSLGNSLWSGGYSYGLAPYLTSATDMDLGANWRITVDALGEVTGWQDAKGQSFSATYDALSRPTSRTEPDPFFTLWTWGSTPSSHNIGQLQSECTGPSGTLTACNSPTYTENESYDSAGRLSQRSIVLGSTAYAYQWAYDPTTGLLNTLTYPTSTNGCQVVVQYGYNNGALASVTDASNATACGSSGTVFWTADAMDPAGHVIKETLGTSPTNLVTNRSYDAVTGWLGSAQSGLGGGAAVKNLGFGYDHVGNVDQRQDNNRGLTENIYYDSDSRFSYSQLVGAQNPNLQLTYDQMGNILTRSDVFAGAGPWTYDPTHKHEVTRAGATSGSNYLGYSYDANGNAVARQGSSIAWSSYNYPTTINAGSGSTAETVAFSYGPDRQRWQQMYVGNGVQETTDYIGGMLELVISGSATNYRHYIYAGNVPIAIYARTNSGNTVYYLLTDHQGGVASIVSSNGTEVVGESFDAFGNRRNPTTWSGPPSNSDLTTIAGITRQGYTFQTALGLWMGLNHMNGRVEDSVTGRMLSADPFIPDVTDAQSYNRFSYVNNNPLTYVDPSGFDGETCSPVSSSGATTYDGPPGCDPTGPPPPDPDPPPPPPPPPPTPPTPPTVSPGPIIYGPYPPMPTGPSSMEGQYCGADNTNCPDSPLQLAGTGASAPAAQPAAQQPQLNLQQIVINSRKWLTLNFDLLFPDEQMWVIDSNGNLVYVPTTGTILNCDDRTTAGASKPSDPNFSLNGDLAVVHTHPKWSLPFPGPEDGVIPRTFHIPNFGISPSGVWVVNPGAYLSVTLLSGTWGTGPNNEQFSPSAYTSRINAPGSGGKAVKCHPR